MTGWFVFLRSKPANLPTEEQISFKNQKLRMVKVRFVVSVVRFDVRDSEVLCVEKVRVVPHQGEVQCARHADYGMW
jgi:hypothetical protein